jgi:hypothetical protein
MSTLAAKPVKVKILNPRLLTIAAVLLLVLALLFLATPLLRSASGFQGQGNFPARLNGQSLPGGGTGFPDQGNIPQGQGLPGQSGSDLPSRQFGGRGGLAGFGLFGGMGGTLVYAIALLISLAAAAGMFMAKRWGQVLGIIMAVLYCLLALVSLLPILLISFMGFSNPLSLILGIVDLLLAVAVIVLASLPGRKLAAPIIPAVPPTGSA